MLLDAAIEVTERLFEHFASGVVARAVGMCCKWLGTRLLQLLSLGRYPPSAPTVRQVRLAQWVGFATIVSLVAAVVWWLGRR